MKVIANGTVLDRRLPRRARSRSPTGGERGLLSLAFAPDFKTNGRLYVNYTDRERRHPRRPLHRAGPRLERRRRGALPRRCSRSQQPYANHNGGGLQFGPDRMLYVGMGDGGSGGDPQDRAQNRRELLGKMLRIDVGEAGAPPPNGRYAIPADNPFVGDGAAAAGDLGARAAQPVAVLLRREQRCAVDRRRRPERVGGDRLRRRRPPAGRTGAGTCGRATTRYPAGAPTTVARRASRSRCSSTRTRRATSVTGGYVYRGSRYPALVGTYLYADFGAGWIGGIRLEAPDGTPRATPEKRVLLETRHPAVELRRGRSERALPGRLPGHDLVRDRATAPIAGLA